MSAEKVEKKQRTCWENACCATFGRCGFIPVGKATPFFRFCQLTTLIASVAGIITIFACIQSEGMVKTLPYATAYNKALCSTTADAPFLWSVIRGFPDGTTLCGSDDQETMYDSGVEVYPENLWQLNMAPGGVVVVFSEDADPKYGIDTKGNVTTTHVPGWEFYGNWDQINDMYDAKTNPLGTEIAKLCAEANTGFLMMSIFGTIGALTSMGIHVRADPKKNHPWSKFTAILGAFLPIAFNLPNLITFDEACLKYYVGMNMTEFEATGPVIKDFTVMAYSGGFAFACLWWLILNSMFTILVNCCVPAHEDSKYASAGQAAPAAEMGQTAAV